MTDFHNANEALDFLRGKGIDTSVGRVFLESDVDKAVKLHDDHRLNNALNPKPKTMAQAKRLIRSDEELMERFKRERRSDVGVASVQAGPDSSSRT